MEITKDLIIEKLNTKDHILTSTHELLSLPIIKRICIKMTHNLKFMPIHVSSNHSIVDGHHRYISSIITGFDLDIISDYPLPSLQSVFDWEDVNFVIEDWDTLDKIKMLNQQDALYNGIDIDELKEIIG